jgi:LPXTG-motif cell wall-anchored protein
MADTDPEELERQIQRTRAELARTVDAIADRVSPKRVVQRNVAKAKANAEHFVVAVGDMVGIGSPPPGGPAYEDSADLWEYHDDRNIAPVLIGVGAVLVVGAAFMLWRRRRR